MDILKDTYILHAPCKNIPYIYKLREAIKKLKEKNKDLQEAYNNGLLLKERKNMRIKELEGIIVCLVRCSGLNKTQERLVKKLAN